jgi:nucleoid-associated protein YgaU
VLAGLPVPDRATAVTRMAVVFSHADQHPHTTHPHAHPHPHAGTTRPERVTVVEGDTLWRLAARTLPASARDARVANRWHHLYELNRDVIGDDPNLIQPGQRLLLPTGSEEDPS